MKAILILDIPDKFMGATFEITKPNTSIVFFAEAKPMPDEKEQWNKWELDFRDESSYRAGWNDCRKSIIGETE